MKKAICIVGMVLPLLTACGQSQSAQQAARGQLKDHSIPFTQEQFMQEVEQNDVANVKLFLQAGMNPNVNTYQANGSVPLVVAVDKQETSVVQSLLDAGADSNAIDTFTNKQALATAVFHQNLAIVNLLLQKGAHANAQLDGGSSPLEMALIAVPSAGADVQLQIFNLLLAHGADPHFQDPNGHTLLMYAAHYGKEQIVAKLLDTGVTVNSQDQNGQTALMCAVESRDPVLVQQLLQAGADPNLKDSEHHTALDLATKDGKMEIRNLLLKAMNAPSSGTGRSA